MLFNGFHHQGVGDRPEWVTAELHLWYWQLRVEKPGAAKRRMLYRKIQKEKLRLAELGINQELIKATCKYLSCYTVVSGNKMIALMNAPEKQLCLDLAVRPDL